MKKLTIVFTIRHANTLGNACLLEMIRYLTLNIYTTIITNKKDFIESQFYNCKVLNVKISSKWKIPFLSDLLDWKSIAQTINEIESDAIFMIVDTSPVTLWLEKPVFQYVHQYGERSDKNKYLVKRAFRSIYKKFMDYYYIKGLRKSLTVFVVSQPIIEILKHKGVTNLILTPHGVKLDKFQKPLINNFHKGLKDLKAREYF
ncbi:MAG: hypothetical protein ACTSRG_27180, partial [Candidatus Helarchaeota archaeon]